MLGLLNMKAIIEAIEQGDPLAKKYRCKSLPRLRKRVHGQFDNILWLWELQSLVVQINTVDAQAGGIRQSLTERGG